MKCQPKALAVTAILLCPLLACGQEPSALNAKSKFWKALSADLAKIATHLNTDENTLGAMPVAGQIVPHKDGGAVLLVGSADAPAVVLIGASRDQNALWTHFDPTSGKHLKSEELSVRILGDGQGNTLLLWAEPAIRAKLYDSLGKLRWTATLAEGEEAVSVGVKYWPDQGWLLTFATIGDGRDGSLTAQLIDGAGKKRWGGKGKPLGANGSPFGANPVFSVQDTATSYLLLWHDFKTVTYQAQRLDAAGKSLWKDPVVVGKGSVDFLRRDEFKRIKPVVRGDNHVRVTLYSGVANDVLEDLEQYQATISPEGTVTITDRRKLKR